MSIVTDGDTFERKGYTFKVCMPRDDDHEAPWADGDGRGIVSDWTRRDPRGPDDLDDDMLNLLNESFQPEQERVLTQDRGSYRYYDIAGSIARALAEGWDAEPYGTGTKLEQAERAVEVDFAMMKAWCNDEWCYVGVVVKLVEDKTQRESIWGIESSEAAYLSSTAFELADEIISRLEVEEPDVHRSEN